MTAPITARRGGTPWVLGMLGLLLLAYGASAGPRGPAAGAAEPGETSRANLPAYTPWGQQDIVLSSQVAAFIFTQQ